MEREKTREDIEDISTIETIEEKEEFEENKIKKITSSSIEEKLFEVITDTLFSYREYIHENGLPIIEEISYKDLYCFLTKRY